MRASSDSARRFLLLLSSVVLLVGCKEKPINCEVRAYFWPAAPVHAGRAPDLRRLGSKLPHAAMESKPRYLEFSDPTHLSVDWLGYGHFYVREEWIFSPQENVARAAHKAHEALPMIRIREGRSEIIRFAFKTRLCEDFEAVDQGGYCREYRRTEELLIAEAVCER